jgi:hypothetical protein
MLSLVICHAEKSVSFCQNSWIVSTMNYSASFGRLFNMSVVSCDVPGALSLFILAKTVLISFYLKLFLKILVWTFCLISSINFLL